MALSFNNIPANVRVPLFYAEVDASRAGLAIQQVRSILIGPKLAAGTAPANVPVLCPTPEQARALAGTGSILAAMVAAFRQTDLFGELYILPITDDAGGTAASGTLTVAGPATEAGTLSVYIAGQKVQVGVASGDTANNIATALAAAINAAVDLPVTAAAVNAVVTATCRHKGALGNDIDMRMNYLGAPGGEKLPAGVTVTVVAMANGATDTALTTALANLGDTEFDYIGSAWSEATPLNSLRTFLNDDTGRWSWARQIYGHAFAAKRDTVGNLSTFGNGRNDQHVSIMGLKGSPSPIWAWAASITAACGRALAIDPARPVQTLVLNGILAPAPVDRFILTEKQTLLFDGISTFAVGPDGTVRLERVITTYQVNAYGQPDTSYLDMETLATLWTVIRRLRGVITTKYPRHKLADDGTRFGPGQAIVTPRIIRAELIAQYAEMETVGLVENAALFEANLIVERAADDPNRINVLWPGDLVNQLRIFAVAAQFRLQYPANAA